MIALSGIAIQSKIYESSNSLVYRGIRTQDEQAHCFADTARVIIKLLKQDYPSPQELTRYRQEYEITRSLNLEGVVKAYSQQDYQRTLIILLEDFGGESLEQWMRQQSSFCPMFLPTFLRLAIALTDILGSIHANNIIHKDINPGNIVFNPGTGVVKIIDFGIATRFNRANPTFKSPHSLEGTLAYLSPEQTGRMNRSLDYRTDFYSLGVTFYELLTGHLPFPTIDLLELIHCHIAKQPVLPHEINATIPKPVSDIILKLMAKNAEDRYQSAWGIKADLEHCLRQLEAKGRIDDIQLSLQDVSDQFQIPQKLYGREAEIAALLAAFDRVAEGKGDTEIGNIPASSRPRVSASSAMMLVSGYAGIGKSALVQQLYKPITAKRGYFISGKFDQFQRDIPYSAIAHALQKLVQQLLGEPDEQLQQWRSCLLEALGINGQLIIDVIPEVELIIGKQTPVPEVGATEAQNRFNRVFQSFVRVFCSKEHPLVIFLDDLQWSDSATLKLIELIMLDEQTQSLFLIGAYRDNEVNPTHPLVFTLERLRKQGAVFQEIILAPLTLEPLSQLIAETLHHNTDTVRSLAQLVLCKTEGNPFFVGEFLRMLHSENLLTFDVALSSWQWNMMQIQAQNITDNVVELLLLKLQKLREGTQQMLRLAACIGSEFDLETLAISAKHNSEGTVCEKSPQAISLDLLTAIQVELIQPLSELDENLLVQEYKFLHDRVQQAAYALIDESQKQIVHLQIGRNLLEKTLPEHLTERLFEIVDHLNYGIELVTNQAERNEIARLDLMAGQKAKGAIAYSTAKQYLDIARAWLEASSWKTDYDLTLDIYTETAEVVYLCGYFEDVKQWAGVVLQEARTILDIQYGNTFLSPFAYANFGFVLCGMVEEYSQAVEKATITKRYLIQGRAAPLEPLYYLYDSLASLATYSDSNNTQVQEKVLENVAVNQKKMKHWADHAPMNYLHKYYLVEAEKARVLGQLLEAEEFYEQAIQGAKENEYIQEEALAYELAAKFYLHRGREKFAQTYMKEAHYCYKRWGATAKLKDLETRYPQFFPQSLDVAYTPVLTTTGTTSNTSQVAFDLVTVLRAFQAISREIELEQLLRSLMQILIENAGAQTGFLILEESGEWTIEASCELNDGEKISTQVLQSVPIANRLCESIIQYVIRTQESVLLNDATREGNFIHDSYVQHNQTQSLFCLPLLNQSKLVGVLYLENQLVTGAFTPERSQVLNLLSTQAAIAIENAKLYSKLRTSESRIKQFLEAVPVGIVVLDAAARTYYFNQQAIKLLGKGIDPSVQLDQLAEVYQVYLTGTDQRYPTERMPAVRALSGERTRIDDMVILHPNNITISIEAWGTPVFDEQGNVSYAIAAFQDITQQKQAEQLLADYNRTLEQQVSERTAALQESEAELRAREQELRLITDALPVAIGYIDAEQRHCFVNRTYEIWRNCSRDEILGKSIRELVDDTAYQVLEPYVNQALAGQTTTFEAEILLPTGKKYLSVTLIPDFDANAQAIGFYALNTDIGHHKKAEEVLRQSEAQFREQAILSAFRADVGSALAQSDRLSLMLHRCVEAVVKHFNAAFARIWTLNKDENILELQASAGMYTRLDGTYSRVPVGSFKVGQIAQDHCPLLTNNVFYESSIDQEWAEREGMMAFAGYPILLEGQLVGVIAMFTRHPIPSSNFEALGFAAHEIALGIRRKQAEVALQASEAELRDVFDELRLREQELRLITDALPVCIAYIDANQQYRFVNHTYEIWCCCSRDEILGKSIREFIGNAMYLMTEPYINQALAGQTTTFEAEMSLPSGNKYISTTLIPNLEGKAQVIGFYALNTDISDRKRAEEASILEERNRMAREIHDTLAQAFTGILVHMGTVSRLVNTNPDAIQTHINTVRDLARSGLTEARRSVAALRPQALEDGNLWTALERFVATLQSSTETSLICKIIGTPYVLPAETENNLLRIAQEAFTNAIRYANATEIRIELVYESTQCFLQIRDNGQGFEVDPTILNRGFGLMGMTERAERIGAQLSIESQLGQGTDVIISVHREASA
ncbi:MAG TPA: hypothetical protein DDZ80_08275 [Cyanobacteria bacterium UBA8803]|nr:hypothetical protein [Cyanobacteria bacterium UBA8803]